MMSMSNVLVSKFPSIKDEAKKRVTRADDLEVDVFVRPKSGDEEKFDKEEMKRLDAERKRLKLILEHWNPDLVSTKARAKTEQEMKRLTMRLRELRARL